MRCSALAESLSIRVNGLIEKIGLMRSELFRNLLTKRYSLTDAFDSELLEDVHDEYQSFYKAVSSWLTFVVKFKFQSVLAAAFLALLAAAVLLFGGRRAVRPRLQHRRERSRTRPISAGCRSPSGRRCCRRWRSASS